VAGKHERGKERARESETAKEEEKISAAAADDTTYRKEFFQK